MHELKGLLQSRLAAAERGEVSGLSAEELADQALRETGAQ